MKFGQYVKFDKIKQKINEEEIKNKKQIKECCGEVENNQNDFDEVTNILNKVMLYLRTILSSNCILHKTELTLIINQILTNHLYKFMKDNIGYEDGGYDEIVIDEKKPDVKKNQLDLFQKPQGK